MKYEQLLIATAYADAMGLPYETKTKEQITQLGGVDKVFIRPDAHSDGFPDFVGRSVGTWSDDTQHALAMARSLRRDPSFDVVDLSKELLAEQEISDAGWGGATKRAMGAIEQARTSQDVLMSGINSAGSGPLMRLAPLALLGAFDQQLDTEKAVYEQTVMTHTDPKALVASYALAATFDDIVSGATEITQSAIDHARRLEIMYGAESKLSERLERSMDSEDLAADVYEEDAFAIWSVMTVAIAVVDKNHDEPFENVIRKVIAEGGDTDSTAAVAAGLYVALHPYTSLESSVIDQLDRSEELATVGREFAALIDGISAQN